MSFRGQARITSRVSTSYIWMLLKPNQFAPMPVRSDCKLVHLDCHLSGQWIKEQENMFRVILFHNASNIVFLLVQLKQKR